MVFLEPSILQAESPQLLQPVLRGEVFQPPWHFQSCPLDLLQQVPALNVGSPRDGDCVYRKMDLSQVEFLIVSVR